MFIIDNIVQKHLSKVKIYLSLRIKNNLDNCKLYSVGGLNEHDGHISTDRFMIWTDLNIF